MTRTVARAAWAAAALASLIIVAAVAPAHPASYARAGLLLLVLLSAASPRAGLLAFAGLSPLTTILATFAAVGIPGTALIKAMAAATFAGAATREAVRRDGPLTPAATVLAPAAVFAALTAASAASQLPALALRSAAEAPGGAPVMHLIRTSTLAQLLALEPVDDAVVIAGALALMLVAHVQCRRQGSLRTDIARMMVIGGIAAAALNVYRLLSVAVAAREGFGGLARLAATARISMHYDRNAAGSYFAMLLPLCAGLARLARRRSALYAAGAVALAIALWLTGSRAALGAATLASLAMAVVIAAASADRAVRRRWAGAALAVIAVAAATVIFYPRARNPTVTASVRGRTELAVAAGRMVMAHPWTGVGVGRFYALSREYGRPALLEVLPADNPHENAHNNFLQIAAELGIPGLIALLWLLGAAVRGSLRSATLADPVALGGACGVLAFVLTWMTGHPLLVPEATFPFFLLLGIVSVDEHRLADARHRWPRRVAVAALVVVAVTLPLRLSASAREADLEHVGYGVSGWHPDAEVGRFRWAEPRSSVFVPTYAGIARLPIRRAPGAGVLTVDLRLDGRPANRIVLQDDGWQIVTLIVPRGSARFRRLDLIVSPAALARPLMLGKVVTPG